jgi:hypothetical protein
MQKGALHIHSTYSDGERTLEELRDVFIRAGCRFACVTDHADCFDLGKLRTYADECISLSDNTFRFIAGLEYGCANGMHILGYGTTTAIDSIDPQVVIRSIRDSGGIAVIAHPKEEAFAWIRSFDELPDGIEVWNTKYDGRYAPRPATFALFGELQARRPDMTAFYGQDLHWRRQYCGMFVEIACDQNDAAPILTALRRGAYAAVKDGMHLPSNGIIASETMARFAEAQARSQRFRRYAKRAKQWADSFGIVVPAAMKAQLRRMF